VGFCTENFIYIAFYSKAMLKKTWNSASLRTETLREIKENIGQSEFKERDFKEKKRRKTLEVRFSRKEKRSKVNEESIEKKSHEAAVRLHPSAQHT
jgi:hypothetical protein